MEAHTKSKDTVYRIVTEKIIEAMDSGVVPWRQPWVNLGRGGHRNLESKRSYRGINQLLLQVTPYEQPWWITWNGAKRLGGQIAPEERKLATIVIFFRKIEVEDTDDPEQHRRIPLLRYYRIWNVAQTEGLEDRVPEPPDEDAGWDPIDNASAIVDGYPYPSPKIKYGGDQAFYSPPTDVVSLPEAVQFARAEDHYAVLFHELTHSTGAKGRLDRDLGLMGSDVYSREELVAEIGAAMLSAHAGIEPVYETTAAYLDHWRSHLADDPKLILTAAAGAQRSCDYILGHEREGSDDE